MEMCDHRRFKFRNRGTKRDEEHSSGIVRKVLFRHYAPPFGTYTIPPKRNISRLSIAFYLRQPLPLGNVSGEAMRKPTLYRRQYSHGAKGRHCSPAATNGDHWQIMM